MVPSIIVGIVVAAILGYAIYTLIGNKKKGRSSCGCGCSGCKLGCAQSSCKPKETKK